MRESQMKKIIATAVAAAFVAPVYAADVSVSGDVEFWYKDTNAGESFDSGDQDIVVTGSETLDNGWSVTASLEVDGNEDGAVSDSTLTIDTGMLTIAIGDAVDPAYLHYDEKSDVAEQGGTSGAGSTNTDPLHTLAVTLSPVENLTVTASRSTTNDDSDAATLSITSYAAQYSMNGFSVAYGVAEEQNQNVNVSTTSLSYGTGPFYIGYESISNVANVISDDQTNVGVRYAYGSGNVFYESGELKDASAGTSTQTTAYGVSYAIGNLNTYVLQNSVETSATATDNQTFIGVEYKF
jgi:hypothetical protein